MCKPVTTLAKDQVLQRLCTSNGDNPKMDCAPSCSSPNVLDLETMLKGFEQNEILNITQSLSDENVYRFCDAKSFIDKFSDFPYLDSAKLEENLIKTLSPEQRLVVDELVEKIKKLSILQQILLYVKLPFRNEDPDRMDPLRRPSNPLGNRSQVSQALAYIKSHFVPDPDVSLPKKEMYIEYTEYCVERKLKPLSNADFGKAMKQVYPVIRPRRLGERGKSRYCYSGLRNRDELCKPSTPGHPNDQERQDICDRICDWASKMLDVPVDNLLQLSKIIPELAPENRGPVTERKIKYIQSEETKIVPEKKQKLMNEEDVTVIPETKPLKQRKASNQLKSKTRKVFSPKRPSTAAVQAIPNHLDKKRCFGKSINRRTRTVAMSSTAKTQTIISSLSNNQEENSNGKKANDPSPTLSSTKLPRNCPIKTQSYVLPSMSNTEVCLTATDRIPSSANSIKSVSHKTRKKQNVNSVFDDKTKCKLIALNNQSNVCDIINQMPVNTDKININSCINRYDLSTEKSTNLEESNNAATDKHVAIDVPQKPRIGLNYHDQLELSNQCLPTEEDNFGIVSIEEDIPSVVDSTNKSPPSKDSNDILTFSFGLENYPNYFECTGKNNLNINFTKLKSNNQIGANCDEGFSAMNSFNNYLQEEGNSQEPEEELLKYFKDSAKYDKKNLNSEKSNCESSSLLEQEEQRVFEESPESNSKSSERDTGFSEEEHLTTIKPDDLKRSPGIHIQTILHDSSSKSSTPSTFPNNHSKRHIIIENVADTLPHSPNTQRKNFIFIPISPRPSTVSKSTVNISPFAFPHETALRGKFSSSTSYCNTQPNPTPSPVLQKSAQMYKQMSPMKGFSQLASLTSSPSPIISGSSSSFNIVQRATHHDSYQEQSDSIKSSPIISPNSSSGVFLSPASSMSSCNSPVFTFQKSLSPVKQTDEGKLPNKPSTSLLQSLLLMGKCPENKFIHKNEKKQVTNDENKQTLVKPFLEETCNLGSHSLSATIEDKSENIGVLPQTKTENSFVPLLTKKDIPSFIDLKPNDLDLLNSVLNDFKNDDNLLIDDVPDSGNINNDNQFVRNNDISMESVISNLYNLLDDREFPESADQNKTENVSNTQPSAPFIYNDSSNSSRDPIVSAFPNSSITKSYPSNPVCSIQNTNDGTGMYNPSAKRNIIPLLDSLAIPDPPFSDEMEIHLNNFENLTGCEEAYVDGLLE